jgi:hypothetical protein
MPQTARILDDIRVASPCTASWDEMTGTDRVRFCRHCDKNVYNFSAMSREEAEALVVQTGGQLCARFYRRADGTMLTDDCPVGLRALRRAAALSWAVIAGTLATVLGVFVAGISYSSAKRKGPQSLRQLEPMASLLEWLDPLPTPPPVALPPPPPPAPKCVMGKVMAPAPAPTDGAQAASMVSK